MMRGMKRLLALIVAANTMVACAAVAAAAGPERPAGLSDMSPAVSESDAEGAIGEQDAIQAARAFAGLSGDYKVREAKLEYKQADYYVNERRYPDPYHHGPPQWTVTFAMNDESPYWDVRLDARTGKLNYLSRYDPSHQRIDEPVWPRITYAEARKIAEMFVDRVSPELKHELQDDAGNYVYDRRYDTSSEERTIDVFRFQFLRVVNGIPFPQNGINLNVDVDGNVVYYYLAWDRNYVFEDPRKAIGMEEVERFFRDHIALSYVIPQVSEDQSPLLIYEQWPNDKLEASTKMMIGIYDRPAPVRSGRPLADHPLEGKPERRAAPFTEEEAASKVKALLGVDGHAVRQGRPISTAWGEVSQFRIDVSENGFIDIFLNDQTGVMTAFYRGEPAKPEAPPIAKEDAQLAAEQFLRKAAPFALHQLVQLQYDPAVWPGYADTGDNYQFFYERTVEGAGLEWSAVSVQVSKATGRVVSYNGSALDYPYPDRLPKTIAPEQAKDEIMARSRLERIYYAPKELRCNDSGDWQAALACARDTDPYAEKTVKQYYQWEWNKHLNLEWLDAQTGEWLRAGTRGKIEQPQADADASGEKTRSVYVEADRSYIRTDPPDPPRIPSSIALLRTTPFYDTTDDTQQPAGTLSPQNLAIIEADIEWNRRGKHWIKIRTWKGDKWIYEETMNSFVPRLPVFITLLEDTPIYSGPDESTEPTAVLAPQDVLIAGAEPDWYLFSGTDYEGAKSWLKIKSPAFGEQWIHLEQFKIGTVKPVDSVAYIRGEPLYDLPYTMNANRTGDIEDRTAHVKAQFVSVLRRSYQIETGMGTKWLFFSGNAYRPIVNSNEQVVLRVPTPVFPTPRLPWPVTGKEKLLQPQTVAAFEKLEENGTWYHVRTSGGDGWINKKIADPEGAELVDASVELTAETRLYAYPAAGVALNYEKLAPQKVEAFEKWVDPGTGQMWYHIETTYVGKAWIMVERN